MRLIGHLADEKAARTFADFLYVRKIDSQVEFEKAEGWAIWINDEDKIEEAAGLLATYELNPADPAYRTEAKGAAELRAQAEKGEAAYCKKVRTPGQIFRPMSNYGFGPLTFVLIAISVVVSILSGMGNNPGPILGLFITDFTASDLFGSSLPEIRHGQLWRLVTPIFIHFGPLHIIFNVLWLRDLGSMIEGRQSSWTLAGLVLVIAAGSNLAQFFFGGPFFGGMSGVVYGLLGYIWLRGKFDPGSGLYLHPTTVTMMIIWFVLCFTPIVPHVANGAHAAGLVMGLGWGWLSSLRHR
ncbi:MAG TPA: rhomboid family intramembrane serine protease [Candidatus Paceibacterota bacterium]|nr:rhomboid family intramembrane serine protease [Verrucomicrobiota bacterium]HSA12010.1 rhomboid family intramembrane serine protease [Candidatus Paceibacterota bacterium]